MDGGRTLLYRCEDASKKDISGWVSKIETRARTNKRISLQKTKSIDPFDVPSVGRLGHRIDDFRVLARDRSGDNGRRRTGHNVKWVKTANLWKTMGWVDHDRKLHVLIRDQRYRCFPPHFSKCSYQQQIRGEREKSGKTRARGKFKMRASWNVAVSQVDKPRNQQTFDRLFIFNIHGFLKWSSNCLKRMKQRKQIIIFYEERKRERECLWRYHSRVAYFFQVSNSQQELVGWCMRIQRWDDFDGLVSLTMKMRRREQFVLMTGEVQQRWKQERQASAHD